MAAGLVVAPSAGSRCCGCGDVLLIGDTGPICGCDVGGGGGGDGDVNPASRTAQQ